MPTIISGTLVDQQGQVWSLASVRFRLQKDSSKNDFYTLDGSSFNTTPPPVLTDTSGFFTITVPANSEISPNTSSWQVTITPDATSEAINFVLRTISGTLDISALFTSIARVYPVQSKFIPRAYGDSEVIAPPNSGQLYYDVVAKALKYWEDNRWNPFSSSAGSMIYPPPGIAVSTGNGWAASISPASLITYPPAGLANSSGTGWLSSVDPTTLQRNISLTTTGNSGPATFAGNVLNIPQYTGGAGGMVYPPAGIAVSDGSQWQASIPPARVAYVDTSNTFTADQTINATLNATTIFTNNEQISGQLTVGNTHVRIGDRAAGGWASGSPNINADAVSLVLNASGNGSVWFNYDQGTGGVHFMKGDNSGVNAATIDSFGNANFSGYLVATGNVSSLQALTSGNGLMVKGTGSGLPTNSANTGRMLNDGTQVLLDSLGSSPGVFGRFAFRCFTSDSSQVAAPVFITNGGINISGDAGVSGYASVGGNLLYLADRSRLGLFGGHCNVNADSANLFLNATNVNGSNGGGIYFNWDSGATGVHFGNGFSSQVAGIDASGRANFDSLQLQSTAPAGQVLTGNGTTYVPQPLPPGTTNAIPSGPLNSQRGFNVAYQNTRGVAMVVSGWGQTNGGGVGSVECRIGPNNPPTQSVFGNSATATLNNGASGFFMVVPNNWYYGVYSNTLSNNQGAYVVATACWVETILT